MNVLITGGNRGLGFELIKVFIESGNDVVTIVRSESARRFVCEYFPKCIVFVSDITKYSDLIKIDYFDKNKIDILINNAGKGSFGSSITDTDSEEIENQIMVHCVGAFNVAKISYPALAKSSQPVIVNISSRLGSMSRNSLGEFTGKGFFIRLSNRESCSEYADAMSVTRAWTERF